MISIRLAELLDAFLKDIDEKTELMQIVAKLAAESGSVGGLAMQTVSHEDHSSIINANGRARRAVSEAIGRVRQVKPSQVYKELNRLEAAINRLGTSMPAGGHSILAAYHERVVKFRDAYDALLAGYGYVEALELFRIADKLHSSLSTTRGVLSLIKSNLIDDHEFVSNEEQQLLISFESKMSLGEMGEKLVQLQRLYSGLCRLLQIHEADHPLHVLKVESGSLVISVSGYAAVIVLLIQLLKEVLQFVYRNYTEEGRRQASLAERVNAVLIQGQLTKHLKEMGIDSVAVDTEIERSSVALAADLTGFVSSGSFAVNGDRVEKSQVAPKTLPSPSQQRQLPE